MTKTQVTGSETTHPGRPLLRRCDLIVFAVVVLLALLLKLAPRLWLSQNGKILARLSFDNRLLCEFNPAQLTPRTYSLEELWELSSPGLPDAGERPENRPENRPEEHPENRPGLWSELPPMFIAIEADGGVRVAASNCPDQYCVLRGVCRKAGDFAACVPNKVVLTLIPAGDHEADKADSGIDMVVGDPAPPEEP